MRLRAFLAPVLAAGALSAGLTAAADEPAEGWIVSPQLTAPVTTESSRAALPQAGLGLDGTLLDSPFYSGFTYRGLDTDGFPEPDWHLEEGADSPYDVDPRQNEYMPRPSPSIVFDLR